MAEMNKARETVSIGEKIQIKGTIVGEEDLYLNGSVKGAIKLLNHQLVVGPEAMIEASIEAKSVIVEGKIRGNTVASGLVSLRKTAVVDGDIQAGIIRVEDGALITGDIEMRKVTDALPSTNGASQTAVAVE
jgi:cytoskeletal protein CcmA (bactofilin family)